MLIKPFEKDLLTRDRTADYLAAVTGVVDTLPAETVTDRCPECGEQQTYRDNDDHIVIVRNATGELVVVVGCEGYWVVDPALAGIDAPNWQPAEPADDEHRDG